MIIHKIRGDLKISINYVNELKKHLFESEINALLVSSQQFEQCDGCNQYTSIFHSYCPECGNNKRVENREIYLFLEAIPTHFYDILNKIAKYTFGTVEYLEVSNDGTIVSGVLVKNGNVSYHKVNIELVK
jgi:hypothetical protein